MTQYSGKVIRKTPVTPTQQSASGVWKLNEQAAAIRNNAWPVAGVPDPISRSVRLRSSASAYFNRTPAIAGNRQKFTWSAWVKLGSLTNTLLFSAGTSTSNIDLLYFNTSTNQLYFNSYQGAYVLNVNTNAVYRDPSAWYHVVLSVDTTQATSTNRIAMYVNGVSQALTAGTGGFGSQNQNCLINSAVEHDIGRYVTYTSYFDGYLTEVNFIDGQALTPSSFGTTDQLSGAWVPMAYTGTYGTNGFYLNFKDNTSTTTLGYDYSGNANNWQANNISLTAGTTYDSMLDVPTQWIGYNTDGGVSVTRGNYCTLNPLKAAGTVANGNLQHTATTTTWVNASSTIYVSSGKWYFEATNIAGNYTMVGVATNDASTSQNYATATNTWTYFNDGTKYGNGSTATAYGASYTTGNVIGVALDMDAGTLTFYKDGVSQGTAFSTGLAGLTLCPWFGSYTGSNGLNANFGQQPFSYTPPTGFKALCTTNLPDPTIKLGAQYMAASTYTGNGSTQSIVNSGNNTTATTFQPDLVWLKQRSSPVAYNLLYDATRGAGNWLSSNVTAAEGTIASSMTAFNSNGFSVGADPSGANNGWNANGLAMVGWQWKANGSAVANTAGSIASQVNAGTTQGFSVVTYTGNGTGGATVGHGLGAAPSMIIIKARNSVQDWPVYHASVGNDKALYLDLTNAQSGSSATIWNNTSPTSSVFSLGTIGALNGNTTTYVAYCWAQVNGYSKFGSYTGNGSADGPFVYCGFRPRYVMIKRTDAAGNWHAMDSSRSTYNVAGEELYPNLSNAGYTDVYLDLTSNGFKIRNGTTGEWNANGSTYIYMAIAENPFKYSNAR